MDPSFELMTWFDGHWSFSVLFISSCGIMTQMLLSLLLNLTQMMQEMTKMQIIFMFQVSQRAFLLLIISVCWERTSGCEHKSWGREERQVFVLVPFISCNLWWYVTKEANSVGGISGSLSCLVLLCGKSTKYFHFRKSGWFAHQVLIMCEKYDQ